MLKFKYVALFIFALISISILLSGCSSVPTNTNTTSVAKLVWYNNYSGPGKDIASSIIQTTDNGFAITGSKRLLLGDQNFYNISKISLIKTDAGGIELWNRTYGEGYWSGTSLVQTRDGGYAITGYFNINSALLSPTRAVLVKTDADGNEAWNTSFDITSGYTIAEDILQSDDGGYVITGGTGPDYSKFRVFMAKFDANGNMAWKKTYIPGSGSSIIRTVDNGYAILDDSNGYDSGILKTDSNGNLAWDKTYTFNKVAGIDNNFIPYIDNGESLNTTTGKSIIQTADGSYVISGITGTYSNVTYFIIKADPNGNEIWRHKYCGPGNLNAISALPSDDGYVLLGSANDNATLYDISPENFSKILTNKILYIKTDANGAEVWKNDIWSGMGQGDAIVKANDGGLVIAGSSSENIFGESDIFLAKVNEYAK